MRVGLRYHAEFQTASKTLDKVVACLEKHGIDVEHLHYELTSDIPDVPHENMLHTLKDLDLVISMGGDGTFLSTARQTCFADVPIIGLNAGRFGFLTEVSDEELESVVIRLKKGDFRIEERRLIKGSFRSDDGEKEYIALNDIVIHRQALSRIISLETYLDDEPVATFEGDGLIVATPTGSTAYNLSAGGSIVHPKVDCLLLTPISPHTLSIRPMVVSSSSRITIIPRFSGSGAVLNITFDGQRSQNILHEDPIQVAYSDLSCKLVRINDEDFFGLLRRKLFWGVNIRDLSDG